MLNNSWIKLAAVSLAGIVVSFVILWGINQFNTTNGAGNMNMGYGYQNRQHYGMNGNNAMNGMNMQGQGSMNGNMQGGKGMMGR